MCLFISLQSHEQYTGRGKRQWQSCLPIISTSTPSSHMTELTSWSHCSRWQHVLSSGQLSSEWKWDVSWQDKSIKLPMWDISELSFLSHGNWQSLRCCSVSLGSWVTMRIRGYLPTMLDRQQKQEINLCYCRPLFVTAA